MSHPIVHRTRGMLRTRTSGVDLYPRVRLSRHHAARLQVDGRLLLGRTWSGGRYYPSHLTMRAGAHLLVDGRYELHTGFRIWVNEGAHLELHDGYANSGLEVSVYESIVVSAGCAISEGVRLRDSDNHAIDGRRGAMPIHIGPKVWLGAGSTVLKGVTVGEGAVVAAGAVVVRDVPPGALVGGVPARVIREGVHWEP